MLTFAIVSLVLALSGTMLWLRARQQLADAESRHLTSQRNEKQALAQVRQRAEMLHRLTDGIGDGLFIVAPDLRVVFVNRAAQGFFRPVTEPVGRPLLECVPDHRVVELVADSARTGRRAHQEFLIATAGDGHRVDERVFSVEAIPLNRDSMAEIDGSRLLVILRDETDKHALEKIRQDFVANASHELRTPLSIINGYLENLTEGDLADPAEAKRAYAIMRKHGDRLAHIVEDLLIISRMESGEQNAIKKEEFDFKACAEDVVHRLTPVITAKAAQVTVIVAEQSDPRVFGDRFYWDQILFNLVSNALKENPARGLKVRISLRQDARTSEIQVRDNGVGIPHGDLPFVFKRFYRVARHHGQDVKGTGLGLSIVKRAVEAHHGNISLSSRPGVETVFTIRVPRD